MVEQYSINKGLKLFGKEGKKAVTKELSQMHDMIVYTPVLWVVTHVKFAIIQN